MKERLSRRTLLKLAGAPLLAPLAAACAPQTDPKVATLEAKIAQLEAEKTPQPTNSSPPTPEPSPVYESSPTTKPTIIAKLEPSPSPTVKPEPTTRPTRVKPEIPELTPKTEKTLPSGVLWSKQIELSQSSSGEAFFIDNKRVFTFNVNGYLEAHDTLAGTQFWEWKDKNAVTYRYQMDAFDPFLYAESIFQARPAEFQTLFRAIDRESGKLLWTIIPEKMKPPNSSGQPIIKDGVIAFWIQPYGSTEKYLRTIDKTTGKILWESEGELVHVLSKENLAVITTNRVEADKTISTTWLTADLKTGEPRKKVFNEYTGNLISRFYFENTVLYAELNVYKQGIGEYSIAAIDIKSAQKLWEFTGDNPYEYKSFIGFPAIRHPDRVYLRAESFVGDMPKNTIMALDKRHGKLLWSLDFKVPKRIDNSDFHADIENTIIFSDREQGISAGIDSSNSKLLWQHQDFVIDLSRGSTKGMFVATNRNKNTTYGIDVRSGKAVWNIPTAYSLAMSKTKVAYFTPTSEVDVLDIPTGKILDKLPITIAPSGVIRFALNDILLVHNRTPDQKGTLTAFKI